MPKVYCKSCKFYYHSYGMYDDEHMCHNVNNMTTRSRPEELEKYYISCENANPFNNCSLYIERKSLIKCLFNRLKKGCAN